MSLTNRQYQYDVIELALDGARSDSAEGLTKRVNSLTILTLDGGSLSIKLNSTSDKSIPLSDNLRVEGVPISEIYWTNTAQAGKTAKIFIIWVD